MKTTCNLRCPFCRNYELSMSGENGCPPTETESAYHLADVARAAPRVVHTGNC